MALTQPWRIPSNLCTRCLLVFAKWPNFTYLIGRACSLRLEISTSSRWIGNWTYVGWSGVRSATKIWPRRFWRRSSKLCYRIKDRGWPHLRATISLVVSPMATNTCDPALSCGSWPLFNHKITLTKSYIMVCSKNSDIFLRAQSASLIYKAEIIRPRWPIKSMNQ